MTTPTTRLAEIAERQALVRSMPEFVTRLTVECGQAATLWLDKYLSEDGGPVRWLDMGAGQRSGMLWQAQIDYLIGILAELQAQLTTAQVPSREDAEIMRATFRALENYALHWFEDGKCLCSMCGERGDEKNIPPHKPNCLITKIRAHADEIEQKE